MNFGLILKQLRTEKKLTQNELAKILNVSKSNISKYEAGSIEPNMSILIRISEYFEISVDYLLGREDSTGQGLDAGNIEERGLDGPGITDILGYTNDEEKIVTFPNKLAYQIDCSGVKITDVANGIGVPETIILKWLDGTDNSYTNYYDKLSEYFKTKIRYWTSPGALSPTIEPNIDEYLLILLYRDYKKTGVYNSEVYGNLEYYFPGLRITTNFSTPYSTEDNEWLSLIHRLPEYKRNEFKTRIEGYLECYEESVAADESLKRTGTDNLGK